MTSPNAYKAMSAESFVSYLAGESEALHYHAVATEITVIVSGRALMNGRELEPDDVVTLAPGEPTDFRALTDLVTTVVKLPCVKGDKYAVMPEESC